MDLKNEMLKLFSCIKVREFCAAKISDFDLLNNQNIFLRIH
jgi:hypothetical protein